MKAEKISQTFNGGVEWAVNGAFFKLLAAPAALKVELFKGGSRVLLADSADAGFYQRIEFDLVRLTNSFSQAVTWIYAPDEGGNDRLIGEVSVISGELARSKAQVSFIGNAVTSGLAANYTYGALWNPAGSGYNLVLNQLSFSVAPAGSIRLGTFTTQLANLDPDVPRNKFVNGAVSAAAARLRWEHNAAAGAFGFLPGMYLDLPTVSKYELLRPTEPIVIPPGAGFGFRSGQVNQAAVMNVDFFEERA